MVIETNEKTCEEDDDNKIREWAKMEFSERAKFNGFNGFCANKLYKDNNAFMKDEIAKSEREIEKDRKYKMLKRLKNE